jgi:unsaturated chondroitin disaccharide hydrolase
MSSFDLNAILRLHTPLTSPRKAVFARAYDLCVKKTRRNIQILADHPKTYAFDQTGNYSKWPEDFFEIGNWTSSFFTGMALLSFEESKDTFFLKQVSRLSNHYAEKVTRRSLDTMHDLGFLYSLYSVGLHKITGSLEHRSIGIKAAEELAKRFNPNGGYIRAWGRMDDNSSDYAGLAIIDCMMNLPLLFWAGIETGNEFFKQVAMRHADMTAQYFVRRDHSVCHAYRFNIATGAAMGEDNYCGAGIGSHWARGTAWAIYGFALAYRYTKASRFLEIADKLAESFIIQLKSDLVPFWDFSVVTETRDSSAAAIAACGLYELSAYSANPCRYIEMADKIVENLASYHVDHDEEIPGILKDAQVGDHIDENRNVRPKNAYTSWGDYFLMEGLSRRLNNLSPFW